MREFFRESWRDSVRIYWTLLRLSLPLLIAIRLLDEHFNFIANVGEWLSPLMALVGLPGQAGIVWATAMFLQLYAAMLVLAALWTQLELSGAQATVLATLMLSAHALPVELRIVQKAGARLPLMLAVRVGGALMLGMLLNMIYSGGGFLQEPATLRFEAAAADNSWRAWFANQAKNWALIYLVILALAALVRLLRMTGTERVLARALSPVLRRMGIGERAATAAWIGMTLGLSYGGALLIDEGRRRDMNRRDMLCALTLLCLCHSVIEDTLAMMLIGADISGVLIARLLFAFVFTAAFARLVNRLPESALNKYMLTAQPAAR